MQTKPRMLILMFTELAREPRANRQIRHFADDFDVTTVGYGAPTIPGVTHIELPANVAEPVLLRKVFYVLQRITFLLRLYRLSYWCVSLHRWAHRHLTPDEWDVIIAHDVNTIPLANRLKSKHGVVADMHEYAPRQYEHSEEWVRTIAPYYSWICRRELPRTGAVMTVSQGIVDEYRTQFGLNPILVTNATPFADLEPAQVASPIRLVHSGIAAPARRLDIMIEAVQATSTPVTLDLYLVADTDSPHMRDLKALAADDPRIRFRDAVPYRDLITTLNDYDVGISLIAATTFNHEWSLPNKFFDFIQARLAIIIGPSPEMTQILQRFNLGAVTEDFDAASLAAVLNSLDANQVAAWKANSHGAADELSGEKQVEVIDRTIRALMTGTAATR